MPCFLQVLDAKQRESDANANDLVAPSAEAAVSPAATSPFADTAAAAPPAGGTQVRSDIGNHASRFTVWMRPPNAIELLPSMSLQNDLCAEASMRNVHPLNCLFMRNRQSLAMQEPAPIAGPAQVPPGGGEAARVFSAALRQEDAVAGVHSQHLQYLQV